eukprot:6390234-Amphidinium_carterae.1
MQVESLAFASDLQAEAGSERTQSVLFGGATPLFEVFGQMCAMQALFDSTGGHRGLFVGEG